MPLQVLGVQVCLVAMRTRILAIRILLRDHALGGLRTALRRRVRPSWSTGQNATTSLRSNDMCGSLLILHKRRLLAELAHLACICKTRQAIDATGRHGAEVWKVHRSASRREGSRCRGWVHHALRHAAIWIVRKGRGQHGARSGCVGGRDVLRVAVLTICGRVRRG